MFIKPPKITLPASADVSYEVRYAKGRKPFTVRREADDFAKEQRDAGGWAEITTVYRVVTERRR